MVGLLQRFLGNGTDVSADLRKPVRGPSPATAFSVAALERAFLKVQANDGGPGGDGVTLAEFDRSRAARLTALSAALIDGSYRPGSHRRPAIPKADGSRRPLAIPCIADRVAQTAFLLALTSELDKRMHPSSFAYRPGRGVRDALAEARRLIASGRRHVVRVDIARYFETVPHEIVLRDLPAWIGDRRMLRLIGAWLRAAAPDGRGLPQGAPVSPMLANIHLDPVDRAMERGGVAFVRYADDMVALARSTGDGQAILERLTAALSARGLALRSDKTGVFPVSSGVCFLGEPLAERRSGAFAVLGRILGVRAVG
jgi:CRISPR-associated protein Cas1